MRLEDYDAKDGKKVWLDRGEVDQVIETADTTRKTIAMMLGARCGLRRFEIAASTPVADGDSAVTAADVVDTDHGPRVRVRDGKGKKYREVPVPGDLKTTIDVYTEQREADPSSPLVDVSERTLQRWVTRIGEELYAETGDVGWTQLGPHDLRRTWGTLLVEAGVEPGMIMVWGGWEDWETFRKHYLGAYSPEMERKQAALVPWLEQRREDTGTGDAHRGGRGRETRR